MKFLDFFKMSKPSEPITDPNEVQKKYSRLRWQVFLSATIGYGLYYVCRLSLNVIKKPIVDAGVLSEGELGMIGSGLFITYAVGKLCNGFLADRSNIRRFMSIGLLVTALINLVLGFTTSFGFFLVLWALNGWAQSMGAAPCVVALSRWYGNKERGSFYGFWSSSHNIGEALTFIATSAIVATFGWQWGFVAAAAAGGVGALLILLMVYDTPESKGLPSIHQLSGEGVTSVDKMPTKELQKMIFKHPGIWIIALSSSFIYITKYAIAGWGVLFLQKERAFSLEQATQIIAFSAVFGVLGTVLAGWFSDRVFKGDRVWPAILSGVVSFMSLALFLFAGGGYAMNIAYVSVFSLSVGVLYCIVAGLMAVDIVPRKATGAALGIVGISSYIAAGLQDITSGYLIQYNMTQVNGTDVYDFGPVSYFWLAAAFVSFVLPVLNWRKMKNNQ
jgi:OPA family sugar phosphate sensor protein UhpC-like MFS transporter